MRRTAFLGTTSICVASVLVLVTACSGGTSPAGPSAAGTSAGATVTSAAPTPPPQLVACPAAAASVLERAASGAHVTVSAQRARGLTMCTYRTSASPAPRVCRSAHLTVNTAAQAYVDFDRSIVEAAQNSSTGPRGLSPVQVPAPALGLEVDWVPAHQMLETGRPGRWVTIVLDCGRRAGALDVARRLAATLDGH